MKKILFLIALVFAFANTNAQKLPKMQATSIRAPQNIKIDGKSTEWNGDFQAFNAAQHIYYTVSNDDNNLYLTVRMSDMYGTNKMFRGGLVFTVIPPAKSANNVSFTFPFIAYNKHNKLHDGNDGGPFYGYDRLAADPIANKHKLESMAAIANNAIKDYKEILVKGLPEISDPVVSIYNTQGIMVAMGFDNKLRYTYELAVPLKYLQAALGDTKSLKYNIMLRAYPTTEGRRPVVRTTTVMTELKMAERLREPTADELFMDNDTDFSGEYTLAK